MKKWTAEKKRQLLKKTGVILLTGFMVTFVAGCGAEEHEEEVKASEPKVQSVEDALDLAAQELNTDRASITYYEVEQEVEENTLVYEVTVVYGDKEYEWNFSEEDGSIVSGPEEEAFEYASVALNVSTADAIQTALDRNGITIDQVELQKVMLDEEHGAPIYEIEMQKDTDILEFEISAEDGTILKETSERDR